MMNLDKPKYGWEKLNSGGEIYPTQNKVLNNKEMIEQANEINAMLDSFEKETIIYEIVELKKQLFTTPIDKNTEVKRLKLFSYEELTKIKGYLQYQLKGQNDKEQNGIKKIEEYIELSKQKENVSDGGSPAYRFDEDGVILVCYSIPNEYGIARDVEEKVQTAVNNKRKKGVNCPYHYEIKRTKDERKNYCWVLQECAKGKSFYTYTFKDKTAEQQLADQRIIMNQADALYDKCVSDVSELFNMGLELKPKNYFYDEKVGFSFIDFLESNEEGLNPNDKKDILWLNNYLSIIYGAAKISPYKENIDEKYKQISNLQYGITMAKNFKAMERTIPNFERFRRSVLRTYTTDVLEIFKQNGVNIGDLSLTDDELVSFNEQIEKIVNSCIEDLKIGKDNYRNIKINRIRLSIQDYGLATDYLFYKGIELDYNNYDNLYSYKYDCQKLLEEKMLNRFQEALLQEDSNNKFVAEAIEIISERNQ